jgi:hypothetical protein
MNDTPLNDPLARLKRSAEGFAKSKRLFHQAMDDLYTSILQILQSPELQERFWSSEEVKEAPRKGKVQDLARVACCVALGGFGDDIRKRASDYAKAMEPYLQTRAEPATFRDAVESNTLTDLLRKARKKGVDEALSISDVKEDDDDDKQDLTEEELIVYLGRLIIALGLGHSVLLLQASEATVTKVTGLEDDEEGQIRIRRIPSEGSWVRLKGSRFQKQPPIGRRR